MLNQDQGATVDAGTGGESFNVAGAFFGVEATQPDNQGQEISNETHAEIEVTEDGTAITDTGAEHESGAGTGEADAVEVWNFNGTEYSQDQVSEAIKHRETFERFNQSIAPLIDNIKAVGQQTERLHIMAVTETDKQIEELKRQLASGRLPAADYQQAHQLLTAAETRKSVLVEAADVATKQRNAALDNARRHNATQVATNLVKSGWTREQMNTAQALAQSAMRPDQFADALTPEFMAILRDAAELRAQKESAAGKLKDKAQKVVRVNGTKTTSAQPAKKKPETGSAEWMSKNFWGQ